VIACEKLLLIHARGMTAGSEACAAP